LTLGLFEVVDGGDDGSILAMVHGTRTSSAFASDQSMVIGSHEPDGPTVCIHSLCVHPAWRARGLGSMILKEYLKRVERESGVERVALIAHDELVPYYERYCDDKFVLISVDLDLRIMGSARISMEA